MIWEIVFDGRGRSLIKRRKLYWGLAVESFSKWEIQKLRLARVGEKKESILWANVAYYISAQKNRINVRNTVYNPRVLLSSGLMRKTWNTTWIANRTGKDVRNGRRDCVRFSIIFRPRPSSLRHRHRFLSTSQRDKWSDQHPLRFRTQTSLGWWRPLTWKRKRGTNVDNEFKIVLGETKIIFVKTIETEYHPT